MKSVEQMITDILQREGGYVNHPADKGGPTNLGITQATLSAHRGYPVSIQEVRELSELEARSIYEKSYYLQPRINLLPEAIQPQMFDIAVNSGAKRAVLLLQECLGLRQDGVIGVATATGASAWVAGVGAAEANRQLAETRKGFYRRIVERSPSQQVFLKGWLRRAAEFA